MTNKQIIKYFSKKLVKSDLITLHTYLLIIIIIYAVITELTSYNFFVML